MNRTRYRNHRTPWTLRELAFVEKHYGSMDTPAIAEHLGRSLSSVRAAAYSLRCVSIRKRGTPWSEEEKEIVRTHYVKGYAHVMALLPGRTRKTIQWMANRLGVLSARSWTREEERILETYYPELGVAVAKRLPGRTADAVKLKACDMGIRYQGHAGARIWSQEELAKLASHDHLAFSDVLKLFPDRSRLSVKKARERLRKKKRTVSD
ncbi:SANT/Myb domain-containing protein [Salmonella enterica]|nr:SANT/Myb domain-containing protein [Salmonella enterica]